MTQVLPWLALALCVFALGHALIHVARSKTGPSVNLWPFAGCAASVLVLGALLTLPTWKPWSAGQTLAPGFLVGGALVLLSAFASLPRVAGGDARERLGFLTAGIQIAAAALGVTLLLIVYPRGPLDALVGCAMGATAAGVLVGAAPLLLRDDEGAAAAAEVGETAALASVALALTTYLAFLHLSPVAGRVWAPLPALLTAVLAVLLNVRAILSGATGGWPRSIGLVFVPLAIVAAVIAFRLFGERGFLVVTLAGLVVFGLLAWIDGAETQPEGEPRVRARGAEFGLVAALLALGGAVLAFQQLHGYGLGLLALAGLAVLAAAPARAAGAPARPLLRGAVVLSVLLLAFRVYTEKADEDVGFEPDFLYYYVALVLGALLPPLLAGTLGRTVPTAGLALFRAGLAGALALLAPLALWLLVGAQPQSAFVVGLAVGAAFLLSGYRVGGGGGDGSAGGRALARLLPLAMALSAIQLTHLLEPLALLGRPQRIAILAVIGLLALVPLLFLARPRAEESRA